MPDCIIMFVINCLALLEKHLKDDNLFKLCYFIYCIQ